MARFTSAAPQGTRTKGCVGRGANRPGYAVNPMGMTDDDSTVCCDVQNALGAGPGAAATGEHTEGVESLSDSRQGL